MRTEGAEFRSPMPMSTVANDLTDRYSVDELVKDHDENLLVEV